MVCHKSRKFLFFAGRVLWTAPASFGGEGQGRANLSYGGGKRAMAGSESGGKRWRGGGRARAVKTGKDGSGIRGQAGMPYRAAVQKVPAALGLRRKDLCRKEKVRPCVRFRSHTEHRHVPGRRACLLLTIQDRTLLQKVLP